MQLTQDAAKEQEEEEIIHGIEVITIDDEDKDPTVTGLQSPGKRTKRQDTLKREQDTSDEDEIVLVDIKRAARHQHAKRQSSPAMSSSSLTRQTRAAAALRHNLFSEVNGEALLVPADSTPLDASINGQSRSWTCQTCTLLNEAVSLICQACDDIRPGLQHWTCFHCHHRMLGDFAQYWLCTKCGRMKTA